MTSAAHEPTAGPRVRGHDTAIGIRAQLAVTDGSAQDPSGLAVAPSA